MNIGRADSTAATCTVVSEFDSVAMTLVELNKNNEANEREAMRDERDAAEAAGEIKLARMAEAADMRLASGLISGGVTIASATVGGIGAGGAEGSELADFGEAFSKGLDGAGRLASSAVDRLGADADMASERAGMAMDRASSRADERRADAEEAGRTVDKMHDSLNNLLSEKRRAEEAATRA